MSTPSPQTLQTLQPLQNTRLNVLYTDNEGKVKSTVLIPPGTIVMWVGSEVPPGWALCNGQNGTPNLINKFIKGGKPKPIIPLTVNTIPPYPPIAGTFGGNKNITLTVDNLPSHKHDLYFSESSKEPNHFHTNIKTQEEINRTTVKHKHEYIINRETVVVDNSDISSSSTSSNMFKNTTNEITNPNTHFHNFITSNQQSHTHICNIKFSSRSIVPSSSSSPTPTPTSSSPSPTPTSSSTPTYIESIPPPPHTNIIPSIATQTVFSPPEPIYIEPPYYVLAFIMKL